ncbi:MAG: VOC family protein, partial [Janthinobacterium lividum]
MNLNHLGLGVTEVPQTVAMFEKYFGLRRVDHSPANDKMGFLNDDSGALITIFRVPDVNYPKIFHIGFMQDTVEQVDAIHEQLRSDGFAPEATREEFGRK